MIYFKKEKSPIIAPNKNTRWADYMVLNPAIIQDRETGQLHMLFRTTGSWKQIKGKKMMFPSFLGYAVSNDNGKTWNIDFSQPALAPTLKFDSMESLYITNIKGEKVINYANGTIEDPRLFYIKNELYLTVAVRMFPAGPYWKGDYRLEFIPSWAKSSNNPFGRAAYENVTVNVIYKIDIKKLRKKKYNEAFYYITNITSSYYGEDRDAFLFPEKIMIDDKIQYILIHRPETPYKYDLKYKNLGPSIFVGTAKDIFEFATPHIKHKLYAKSMFKWEKERIGGSFPPVKISSDEWLFCYHGKENDEIGYTQSFMILKNIDNHVPKIIHRCSERLLYADRDWELPKSKYTSPCLFATSGVIINNEIVIGYGAADELIGIARIELNELVDYIKTFDEKGNGTFAKMSTDDNSYKKHLIQKKL